LNILNDAEYRSHHDKSARNVQSPDVFAPADFVLRLAGGGAFIDSGVEHEGGGDENAEKEDLDEEAGDDDLFAGFDRGVGVCVGHGGSTCILMSKYTWSGYQVNFTCCLSHE
jgi:hypothetical protein